MRPLILFATLALAPISALAQNLQIPASDVGARITAASARIGEQVEWGPATCGEPQYLRGTCVWKLGPELSLTTHAYDPIHAAGGHGPSPNATIIITRWSFVDLHDGAMRKVFNQSCRALVATLLPDWPTAKVLTFTNALIDSPRPDRSAKAEGIEFAFYSYPGSITCEAQQANG